MPYLNRKHFVMIGNRYLLDTNPVVKLLRNDCSIIDFPQNASWIGVSILSKIEFLSFRHLDALDIKLFEQFLSVIEVVNITTENNNLIDCIAKLRQQFKLKLPDAIIAATAITENAILVTGDSDFKVIKDLVINQP